MSLVLIGRALEKHLGLLSPFIPTATENGTFTPTQGQPYQEMFLLPAATETTDYQETIHIERGILQINVCFPADKGAVACRERVELIRNHYRSGLRLVEGDVTVELRGKPTVAPAINSVGFYCIPLRIRYTAITRT